ncbi:MAG TPA: aryl-sulfate sulfotransferase [Terriglobia bacterium]|nr:aryl-sulfate sulfotransferase [Terriglobia bacterium]
MPRRARPVLIAFVLAVMSLQFVGCGGTANTPTTPASLRISPQTSTVSVGDTLQFMVTATGGAGTSVTWSVNGTAGGNSTVGTIDANGIYTPPMVPPSPNTVTVQATSTSNSSLSASASISIVNPAGSVDTVAPGAVVTGSGDTSISIMGTGFTIQSSILLNGTALASTYVSKTELAAKLPAALLTQPAVFPLVVSNPAPGGGTSTPKLVTIIGPGQVSKTANQQVASYSITPPRDASVMVEFGPDTNYGLKTWTVSAPPGGGPVNILVAGMRRTSTYHMRAVVQFPDGVTYLDADHTFDTGGLTLDRIPVMTEADPSGSSPTPGVELYCLTYAKGSNKAMAVASDPQGNIVWYYDYDPYYGVPFPIKLLPNGHMLALLAEFGTVPSRIREIDLAGNTLREVTINDVNQGLAAGGFGLQGGELHHDMVVLPNGHMIVLINTETTFNDLPGYPGPTNVIGDALVDLDTNLKPVWVWNTFDHLDVNRHPMGFPPDWTHSNAVVYTPEDGNLLLSMRHQHWVIKIDYRNGAGTGKILWRLGYQGDMTLDNGTNPDWFFAQHYPSLIGPTRFGVTDLILFDNGDNRVMDANGTTCGSGSIPCYSRAAIFRINEAYKTAHLVWDYKLPYSYWGGSAQVLDNSNVFVGVTTPADNPTDARALEITQGQDSQVVWRLDVSGQLAYRIVHLPSLYPGVQW